MGLGSLHVFSSSYIFALETYGNSFHFFIRQSIFMLLSFGIFVMAIKLSWKNWLLAMQILWVLAAIGVVLTFFFAVEVGGARRWLDLAFGFRVQSVEFLKCSYPFILTWVLTLSRLSFFQRICLFFALCTPLIFVILQPDFGSFVIVSFVILGLLFVYGLQWKYIFSLSFSGAIIFVYFLLAQPYRVNRVKSYLDPWKDPQGQGFQLLQNWLSIQRGSFLGQGAGQSQGKLFFLPEAHTDFAMAILFEEWGFLGFLFVLGLCFYLLLLFFQLASKSDLLKDRALLSGLGLVWGLNCFLNISVVLGLLPAKGLAFPFMSYGGSSFLAFAFVLASLVAYLKRGGK